MRWTMLLGCAVLFPSSIVAENEPLSAPRPTTKPQTVQIVPASVTDRNSSSETLPEKIGFVDMAKIFQGSKEFAAKKAAIVVDVQQTQKNLQAMGQNISEVERTLKAIPEGTKEHDETALELDRRKRDFESFRNRSQLEFKRVEANLYRGMYLRALHVIDRVAKRQRYTIVFRTNSDRLDENTPPNQVTQKLNGQRILFSRPERDLTDEVIRQLNADYDERTSQDF